jgi:hypothetical protein
MTHAAPTASDGSHTPKTPTDSGLRLASEV